MGRKIPAKKHHGVKDPVKQNEARNAKIKLKINQAPANVNNQEVPKKVRLLFKAKDKKSKPHSIRTPNDAKKPTKPNERQPTRPLKKTPNLKRLPGETDKELLWRAEVTTRKYIQKAKFENKYDIDVEVDETTGEVMTKKRNLSFLDDEVKPEPKNKWEKKKLKKLQKIEEGRAERAKLRKEKFKMKKMMKKNKKSEKGDLKYEKVEFGEVAEQPPTLTAKPRKSAALEKPGNRNLLLKNLMPSNGPAASSNLSGKRKDLSALDRLRLEEERERAVSLYREMQKLKQTHTP